MAIFDDPMFIIILMVVVVLVVIIAAVAARKKKPSSQEPLAPYSPYSPYPPDEYGQYPSYNRFGMQNPQINQHQNFPQKYPTYQNAYGQFGYSQYTQPSYQYPQTSTSQQTNLSYGNSPTTLNNQPTYQYNKQPYQTQFSNQPAPNTQAVSYGNYGNQQFAQSYGTQYETPQPTFNQSNQVNQYSPYPYYPQVPEYQPSQTRYQQEYEPQIQNRQPEPFQKTEYDKNLFSQPTEYTPSPSPQSYTPPPEQPINEVAVSQPTVISPPRKKPKIIPVRKIEPERSVPSVKRCSNCNNELGPSGSCEYCEISSLITKASNSIESARSMGIDVSQAESTLQHAKDALAAKIYDKVKQLCSEIETAIELLKEEYKKTQTQLEQTQLIVSQYEQAGVDVTHGKRLLQMAEAFLMSGKYDKAIQYAQKVEKMGKEAELRKKIESTRPKISPPKIVPQAKCAACGSVLEPNVNTCNKCGTPIQITQITEKIAQASEQQEIQQPVKVDTQPQPQEPQQVIQPEPQISAIPQKTEETKLTVIDNAAAFQVTENVETKPKADEELLTKDESKPKEVRLTAKKKDQTPEQRREEYMKKATEQIQISEEAVNEIEKLGIDIMHAKNLLQLAKSFMRGKNYEKAYQYAVKSEHVARDLERRAKAGG